MRLFSRTKTILVILIIIILAIAIVKKRRSDLAKLPPPRIIPAVVDITKLKSGDVTLTLPALAVVASDVSTVLSTKISGRILAVTKKEGDMVKKGEVLVRIDATDLESRKQGLMFQRQGIIAQIEAKNAEIAALATSLKTAQESHARTKELLAVKGASPEQYSQEEAEIARIKANLKAAQKTVEILRKNIQTLDASIREIDSQISYATLLAPIDGRVAQIFARPGDLATPGKPLIRISSKSGLYLNISLPDTVKPQGILLQNQQLHITPRDQTGETGLIQYVATLPENSGLVEGQLVNVRVIVWKGKGVLVPFDALLTVGGRSSVFVVNDSGKVERRNVLVKARGAEGVVVDKDLSGAKVVIAKPDILLRISTGVPVVIASNK